MVVATFAKAIGVKRDGNYYVGLEMIRLSRHDFGQLGSEPIAEAGDLFVFEQQDRAVERVIVNRVAAGACE